MRALSLGCPVIACPTAGDMNENASRVDWAGVGVRVPRRYTSPRPLRLAVEHALATPSMRSRAQELAQWTQLPDPGETAATLVEGLATNRVETLGVGLEPTTLRLTAECSAD